MSSYLRFRSVGRLLRLRLLQCLRRLVRRFSLPRLYRPQPTATPIPQPTPTPLPTATPRPPRPGSTEIDLGGGIVLSISPEAAVESRDVSFALTGRSAWEPVSFTFVDPQGIPASWFTAEDVHVLELDRSEVTTIRMYPTTLGELEWPRYGAQDEEGE